MIKNNIWLEKAMEIEEEIIYYRRELHKIPELGFEEVKTSRKIKTTLEDMGIKAWYCGITGVVALIEGADKTGPVVCLRADMDAMPVNEETGFSFSSCHKGIMHCCGHDGHVAILLGAARLLKENRDRLRGKVKLLFQPAEELVTGADKMIEDGALEDPVPDYILGLHLWQPLKLGEVGIKKGEIMASTDNFKVIVYGREAHGAMPHEGVDAISITAEFVQGIYHLLSRVIPAGDKYVLSFGKIKGGNRGNVLASRVELDGTYRTFEERTRDLIRENIELFLDSKKEIYGIDWEYILESFANPTYNDSFLTEEVLESIKKIILYENIVMPYGPVFPSEDFSEYARRIPGIFFFLGAGGEEYNYPHHHPGFDFDEKALIYGAALFLQIVEDLMSNG